MSPNLFEAMFHILMGVEVGPLGHLATLQGFQNVKTIGRLK
jgi:hypothetical protein